jgi:hypothetical protein
MDPWAFWVFEICFVFIFPKDRYGKQANYPNHKHHVNVDKPNIFAVSIHNNLLFYGDVTFFCIILVDRNKIVKQALRENTSFNKLYLNKEASHFLDDIHPLLNERNRDPPPHMPPLSSANKFLQ